MQKTAIVGFEKIKTHPIKTQLKNISYIRQIDNNVSKKFLSCIIILNHLFQMIVN